MNMMVCLEIVSIPADAKFLRYSLIFTLSNVLSIPLHLRYFTHVAVVLNISDACVPVIRSCLLNYHNRSNPTTYDIIPTKNAILETANWLVVDAPERSAA